MIRIAFILAGLYGAAGVALGAASAHGLEERLSPQALVWMATASRYMLWHAPALGICAALLLNAIPHTAARNLLIAATALFALGTLLFCGSLLTLALGGPRGAGAIAPFGGMAMILGWIGLGTAGALMAKRTSDIGPNRDS